jgi:hypothetical protein
VAWNTAHITLPPCAPTPQLVSPLTRGAVALDSASLQPENALVVDEYTHDTASGRWGLRRAAVAAAEFLHAQGLRVSLVPDVAAAAAAGGSEGVGNAVHAVRSGLSPQSTNHVLMVAPTAFGFNEQAAQDNAFMHASTKAQEGGNPLTNQVRWGYEAARLRISCKFARQVLIAWGWRAPGRVCCPVPRLPPSTAISCTMIRFVVVYI